MSARGERRAAGRVPISRCSAAAPSSFFFSARGRPFSIFNGGIEREWGIERMLVPCSSSSRAANWLRGIERGQDRFGLIWYCAPTRTNFPRVRVSWRFDDFYERVIVTLFEARLLHFAMQLRTELQLYCTRSDIPTKLTDLVIWYFGQYVCTL